MEPKIRWDPVDFNLKRLSKDGSFVCAFKHNSFFPVNDFGFPAS